jgi:hypothetical protein
MTHRRIRPRPWCPGCRWCRVSAALGGLCLGLAAVLTVEALGQGHAQVARTLTAWLGGW